ncbi:MAG: hypothetical protein JWN98_2564 [Abditibacteriota bacterium]|nr:hypothetical protein [Abditibacteriota bacterium]
MRLHNDQPSTNTTSDGVQEITPELLKSLPLRDFSDDADKADYGKLIIVAGSARLPGAAILAARAALRSGCGTVRVAAPQSVATAIGITVPELMVIPLPETSDGTIAAAAWEILEKQFEPCDAAVIGPGLDSNAETEELCRKFLAACPLPTLVDATALLAYANQTGSKKASSGADKAPRVWTPHLAEMQSLLGSKKEIEEEQRESIAREWAASQHSTLVFKGRETLIAGAEGALYKNTAGTRGLGTAGSGDVLAGLIGGFLAQGMDAARAAIYGVHVHALAGEAAEKDMGDDGMIARDFLERVPSVLRYLRRQVMPRKEESRGGLRPA